MSSCDTESIGTSRPDLLTPSGVVDRIDELLEVAYRSADLGNFTGVLDEAVYILLSLQTREAVYQRVFRELKSAFPTWRSVLDATEGELVEVLRPAGFQAQRAAKLRALLGAVARENR